MFIGGEQKGERFVEDPGPQSGMVGKDASRSRVTCLRLVDFPSNFASTFANNFASNRIEPTV
jgi:hypothetical protein